MDHVGEYHLIFHGTVISTHRTYRTAMLAFQESHGLVGEAEVVRVCAHSSFEVHKDDGELFRFSDYERRTD